MFKERIQDNIKFTKNLLDTYPIELDRPPHCSPTQDEKFRFKPSEKKIVDVKVDSNNKRREYLFDQKTNEIASPKMKILREAMRINEQLLEKFVNNFANSKVIKKNQEDESNDTEVINTDEGMNEQKNKSKLHMTTKEKREEEEKRKFLRAKKEHQNLITRKTRLIKLIQEEEKVIEKSQVSIIINKILTQEENAKLREKRNKIKSLDH